MTRWLLATCTALALAIPSIPAFATVGGTNFVEVPDAGDTFDTAQWVTGGPYDGISGNVGGSSDMSDFFYFGFAGGELRMQFTQCDGCGVDTPLEAILYDANRAFVAERYYSAPLLTIQGLSAGNYYLDVTSNIDPPFTISLTGPTTAQQGIIFAPTQVAEPATLAILGLGLAGLGWSRRRKD